MASDITVSPTDLHKFAPILHLPLFPLYGANEVEALRKEAEFRQEMRAEIESTPKVSAGNKVGLQVLGAVTGTTLFSMDSFVSTTLKFGEAVNKLGTLQTMTLVYTRWAIPLGSTCPPLIVDELSVCGIRGPDSGGSIYLKVNRDALLRVAGKHEAKCKQKKKYWSRLRGLRSALVDLVALEPNGEFALEKVVSMHMPASSVEFESISKRWKKNWNVPS